MSNDILIGLTDQGKTWVTKYRILKFHGHHSYFGKDFHMLVAAKKVKFSLHIVHCALGHM